MATRRNRVFSSFPDDADWGFGVIVLLVAAVAGWLLAMPWKMAVVESTMRRFHLTSSSFVWFALQQPIPAMYNFRNTAEVRRLPTTDQLDGLIDPLLTHPIGDAAVADSIDRIAFCTLNHFPTRSFTFGDGRDTFLRTGDTRWFVLESSYRGSRLTSVRRLARGSKEWIVQRESESFEQLKASSESD